MSILKDLKKIYELFPLKFRNKSIVFVFLLIFAAFLEALGIGILYPLMEFFIKGNFSSNIFGIKFENITLDLNNKLIIKIFVLFIIFLYLFKAIFLVLFNYWQLKFAHSIFKNLSLKLLNRYLLSSIAFHHTKNSTILMRNVLHEARNYGNCVNLILKLIAELLIVIFVTSLIIYIEPLITSLLILAVVFFAVLFYFLTSKKIYEYGDNKLHSVEKSMKKTKNMF